VRMPRLANTRGAAGTAWWPPGTRERRDPPPREDNEQDKKEYGDAGSSEWSVSEGRRGSQRREDGQDSHSTPAATAPGTSAALLTVAVPMPTMARPDYPSQIHETSQTPQPAPADAHVQDPAARGAVTSLRISDGWTARAQHVRAPRTGTSSARRRSGRRGSSAVRRAAAAADRH
jgi:hypothetical protein